jgi:hypothetical protein
MAAPQTNGNGYARIGLWASIIVATLSVIGSIAYFSSIAYQTTANGKDIEALKSDIRELKAQNADLIAYKARNCQELAKIETQFGTVEEVINDIHVQDLRTFATIKYKLFNDPPTAIYHEVRIPHELEPCN